MRGVASAATASMRRSLYWPALSRGAKDFAFKEMLDDEDAIRCYSVVSSWAHGWLTQLGIAPHDVGQLLRVAVRHPRQHGLHDDIVTVMPKPCTDEAPCAQIIHQRKAHKCLIPDT